MIVSNQTPHHRYTIAKTRIMNRDYWCIWSPPYLDEGYSLEVLIEHHFADEHDRVRIRMAYDHGEEAWLYTKKDYESLKEQFEEHGDEFDEEKHRRMNQHQEHEVCNMLGVWRALLHIADFEVCM